MATAKTLRVNVAYEVELGDVEMPQQVLDQLTEAMNKYATLRSDSEKYGEALEWIGNNIREKDCCNWEVEIDAIY